MESMCNDQIWEIRRPITSSIYFFVLRISKILPSYPTVPWNIDVVPPILPSTALPLNLLCISPPLSFPPTGNHCSTPYIYMMDPFSLNTLVRTSSIYLFVPDLFHFIARVIALPQRARFPSSLGLNNISSHTMIYPGI